MDDPMDIDSDFYGDEETIASLNARVSSFNPPKGPRAHGLPTHLIRPSPTASADHLHNRYAGHAGAWQLSETVDAFLARLPPSTTPVTLDIDWIWITNPFIPPSPPLSFDPVALFEEGGMARLHLLTSFITQANASRKPATVIGREIGRERALAVQQILDLAQHLDIKEGKWMLFPEPCYVDEVWGVVARYTASGELGISAKVAPLEESGSEKERLICVYTRDFRDKEDIARVLRRLREVGLVKEKKGRIYYKCDAFTYLGIGGGNTWGIKASMYSSTELFEYMKKQA
ncbi:hypothetical protein DL546_000731 [Coniochaeta pulveracea]|uniref:DUF1917-domain-containing protein n=1 Tax=Coniochaeta pulveracea TaxID=177199 RepID=A0A420YCJ9_9PEZI|nr:hypothetical protein DL546_000731 [Coniochaeta pulveracea]